MSTRTSVGKKITALLCLLALLMSVLPVLSLTFIVAPMSADAEEEDILLMFSCDEADAAINLLFPISVNNPWKVYYDTAVKQPGRNTAVSRRLQAKWGYENLLRIYKAEGSPTLNLNGKKYIEFDFYISDIKKYNTWWKGFLNVQIAARVDNLPAGVQQFNPDSAGAASGAYASFPLPDEDVKRGWNHIKVDISSVEDQRIVQMGLLEEVALFQISVSAVWGNVSPNYYPALKDPNVTNDDCSITIAIDNVYASGQGKYIYQGPPNARTRLEDAIREAEFTLLKKNKYTQESWSALNAYVDAVKSQGSGLDDLTEQQLNALTDGIRQRMDALVYDAYYRPLFTCDSDKDESRFGHSVSFDNLIKTEGTSSISINTVRRYTWENSMQINRADPDKVVSVNGARYIEFDLYISNIEKYNRWWKGRYTIQLAAPGSHPDRTAQSYYATFPIPDDNVKQGWNHIIIDISNIGSTKLGEYFMLDRIASFTMSTSLEWGNTTPNYWPTKDGTVVMDVECSVKLAIDDIYASGQAEQVVYTSKQRLLDQLQKADLQLAKVLKYTSASLSPLKSYVKQVKEQSRNFDSMSDTELDAISDQLDALMDSLVADAPYYVPMFTCDPGSDHESQEVPEGGENEWLWPTAPNGTNRPTYDLNNKTTGAGSVSKRLINSYCYENTIRLVQLENKLDLTNARQLEFDLYISNIEKFNTYWDGRLYVHIAADGYDDNKPDFTDYASFPMPAGGYRKGWNHVIVDMSNLPNSKIAKAGRLDEVTAFAVTTGAAWGTGTTYKPAADAGGYVEITIGIDDVYASGWEIPQPKKQYPDKDATYLTDCEKGGLTGEWSPSAVTFDTRFFTTGASSVTLTLMGNGVNSNTMRFVSNTLWNLRGAKTLHFDLYVGNLDLLVAKASLAVQISSSLRLDTDCLTWYIDTSTLQEGWNSLSLNFKDAFKSGNPDLENMYIFYIKPSSAPLLEPWEKIKINIDNLRVRGSSSPHPSTPTPGTPDQIDTGITSQVGTALVIMTAVAAVMAMTSSAKKRREKVK